MDDTVTPLLIQIMVIYCPTYGKEAPEHRNSHVFARINAFSSRARLGKIVEIVSLGIPVRGVIETADSAYGSSQKAGWPLSLNLHLSPTHLFIAPSVFRGKYSGPPQDTENGIMLIPGLTGAMESSFVQKESFTYPS